MPKIVFFLKQSWLLMLAALTFGLTLAAAEAALAPRIEANRKAKLERLCKSLITDANRFEVAVPGAEVAGAKGKTLTTDILRATDGQGRTLGYAFIAEGPGFADKIRLVIAVDARAQTFFGYDVLASNETPGFGDKIKESYLRGQFAGAPVGALDLTKVGDPEAVDAEIVAISGATVSSEAVINIFNTFVGTIRETLVTEGLIHGN